MSPTILLEETILVNGFDFSVFRSFEKKKKIIISNYFRRVCVWFSLFFFSFFFFFSKAVWTFPPLGFMDALHNLTHTFAT